MDAHVFRLAQEELLLLLEASRLEKIHGPHPDTTVFTLFDGTAKRKLVLRHGRAEPLLFLTSEHISNPQSPPAPIMRLRKYCQGRKLGRGLADFDARKLALPVCVPPQEPPRTLVLDLTHGPKVQGELTLLTPPDPLWPDDALIESLCAIPWSKKEKEGPWQTFSVLTPLLRESLAALDPQEGKALMRDLEAGGGELFLYANEAGEPFFYAAWPLPEPLVTRRRLAFIGSVSPQAHSRAYPLLEAVSRVDAPRFFSSLKAAVQKDEQRPEKRESKKLQRLGQKLDQEEERLRAMLALRKDAQTLQGLLWQYPPDAKLSEITLPQEHEEGPERVLPLNAFLTVRENMLRMFKESARGKRGLAMLAERRRQLAAQSSPDAPKTAPQPQEQEDTKAAPVPLVEEPGPLLLADDPAPAYRHVARFRSSDGFLLLRGKNAKGNQNALKLAKGHDLWLHAEGGPSAHLIIRRSHAAEEVPERTLDEAARLVWEKSWRRHDAKALIMLAFARHVHSIKGAAPGTVKVDEVCRTLSISDEE